MKMGLAIARRREELGMTQEELANAVGVTKSSISRWESGDISNMRRDRIHKLAAALKVSPVDLLADETEGLKEKAPHISARSFSPDGSIHVKIEPKTLEKWVDDFVHLNPENRDRLQDYLELLLESQGQDDQEEK